MFFEVLGFLSVRGPPRGLKNAYFKVTYSELVSKETQSYVNLFLGEPNKLFNTYNITN